MYTIINNSRYIFYRFIDFISHRMFLTSQKYISWRKKIARRMHYGPGIVDTQWLLKQTIITTSYVSDDIVYLCAHLHLNSSNEDKLINLRRFFQPRLKQLYCSQLRFQSNHNEYDQFALSLLCQSCFFFSQRIFW